MNQYLGEQPVTDPKILEEFNDPIKAALRLIEKYSGIDGDHHKAWLLDQIARALHRAPISVKIAVWTDRRPEIRTSIGTCTQYADWVVEMKNGEDGPNTYGYDEGIAP
jgi:hypothetical protein